MWLTVNAYKKIFSKIHLRQPSKISIFYARLTGWVQQRHVLTGATHLSGSVSEWVLMN